MRTFADRFLRILAILTTTPQAPVGDIDLLSPTERAALAPVRGRPGRSVRTLPQLLTDAAATDPDAIALTDADRTLTYRQLDTDSNRLARWLIEHGAGPEGYVAVGLSRSLASVLAVWAITKTGAAFVPIDPHYPTDRIHHMLTDSGPGSG